MSIWNWFYRKVIRPSSISKQARFITAILGKKSEYTPETYVDDKIKIQTDWAIVNIYIRISKAEVKVYMHDTSWRGGGVVCYRPGCWEAYLKELYGKAKEKDRQNDREIAEKRKIAFSPIDDCE